MERPLKDKKVRLCVNIDESNWVLLKWLKINWQDDFSFTVNNLVTRYRNDVTNDMTALELEQIESLKVVGERGVIDVKKIGSLRSAVLMGKVDETLKDRQKRQALKEIIELYDND